MNEIPVFVQSRVLDFFKKIKISGIHVTIMEGMPLTQTRSIVSRSLETPLSHGVICLLFCLASHCSPSDAKKEPNGHIWTELAEDVKRTSQLLRFTAGLAVCLL